MRFDVNDLVYAYGTQVAADEADNDFEDWRDDEHFWKVYDKLTDSRKKNFRRKIEIAVTRFPAPDKDGIYLSSEDFDEALDEFHSNLCDFFAEFM